MQSRTLYDPNRSFWSRYLDLDLLSDSDFGEVLAEINKSYCLPPPPQVPEKLELRYAFHKSATFEQSGIQLKHGRVVRDFKWSDVEDIHIHRWEPVSRDLCTVVITLPGSEIELSYLNYSNGNPRPAWQGAAAEEISEFFLSCPARDRVHISNELEGWTRLRDVDRALAIGKTRVRWLSIIVGVFTTSWVVLMAYAGIREGTLALSIVMTLLLLSLTSPLVLFGIRAWRAHQHKLESQRAVLENESLVTHA